MEDKPVVVSKQKTEVVCGVPTQVVCTAFSSHILVVVTQFGKMGTLVSLEPSNVANDISKPALTTKVLLGQDEVKGLGEESFLLSYVHKDMGCLVSTTTHTHTDTDTVSIFQGLSDPRVPWLPLVTFPSVSAFYSALSGVLIFITQPLPQFDPIMMAIC